MIKRNRGRTKGGNQMLDFRVYTFLAVCEYMNYTRAAEALHITQPAVSQHIRYLENMYQVKLFLAEGKKIHLSPAGERLLHAATTESATKAVSEYPIRRAISVFSASFRRACCNTTPALFPPLLSLLNALAT